MSLIQDVTFESLGAVRAELSQWLRPEAMAQHSEPVRNAARDALVAAIMYRLAEEIGQVRARRQLQKVLRELQTNAEQHFVD